MWESQIPIMSTAMDRRSSTANRVGISLNDAALTERWA